MTTALRTTAIVIAAHLLAAPALAQPATVKAAQPATTTTTPPPAANPAPGTAPPAPGSATTAAPQPPPTPPANYKYDIAGRRDPFVSLLNRGTDARNRSNQPKVVRAADGAGALTADEVAVRGILLNRGTWIAMVTGPGGKTFSVKAGDRLADGVIRAVTPQALIIMQEVNDPLSLEKQREVRKPLRGGEVK
jgi:Tfp pilus assembly protein PilP